MFRINSERELLELLKIVSQEAVKKSKKMISEGVDTAQERYMSNLRASETTYGVKLSEQEEDAGAPPDDEAEAEEPPPEETEASPEASPEESPEEDQEAEGVDPETLGVSFDSVVKDINTLRAGRSTKDKEIKDELLGYYDRLDDDERKILHLFLSEISKILQGAIEATDAQDPSEPPFNAEITFGAEEGEEPDAAAEETPGDEEEPGGEEEPGDEEEAGGEDSSPPIKVNEAQSLHEIRKKVQRLMKRY